MLAIFPVTISTTPRHSFLSPMPPHQTTVSSSNSASMSSSLCGNHHDDELESLFQSQFFHQGPSFQLSSWSSGSTATETTSTTTTTARHVVHSYRSSVSLPFANVDHETHHDDSDGDDDDDDDDDSMSCDWSMESDDEDDEHLMTEAHPEAEKVLEEPSRRRVRFSESILIRCYQKPEREDVPQLYYSAHELQKIIDEYVMEQRNAAAAVLICPGNIPQPVAAP